MTKLSLVLDHEIRCWMLGSSSILSRAISKSLHQPLLSLKGLAAGHGIDVLVQLVNKSGLHHLGLLSSSSSSNSLVRGCMIIHIPNFSGAIGGSNSVCACSITIGTAMDRGTSARGRRSMWSEFHRVARGRSGRRRNGGGKDRKLSSLAGRICSTRESGISGRGIGEAAHLARRNRGKEYGRGGRRSGGFAFVFFLFFVFRLLLLFLPLFSVFLILYLFFDP